MSTRKIRSKMEKKWAKEKPVRVQRRIDFYCMEKTLLKGTYASMFDSLRIQRGVGVTESTIYDIRNG